MVLLIIDQRALTGAVVYKQLCMTSATHRKRHRGIKEHHCQYCGFAAIQSIDIIRHEMRHHTKEKPFLCDLCGRGFIDVWSLKNHINSKRILINGTFNTRIDLYIYYSYSPSNCV